jgi:transposase
MKDGRTHLAHKAEHAVDLETGAVVGVTVQDADKGDTTTSIETLIEAAEQIEAVVADSEGPKELVADKGYHSNQALVALEAVGVRSYISEPDRGRHNWKGNPEAREWGF